MNGHYTTRAGNVSYFLDLLHLFSLQSSRRVGPMPQRFMLSLHIHRHLFPVEVTPQLPLQVIEVYASISCWEPSTDMKSLLHFPQACREMVDCETIWRHILCMTSFSENRGCVNELIRSFAHARTNHLGPRMRIAFLSRLLLVQKRTGSSWIRTLDLGHA